MEDKRKILKLIAKLFDELSVLQFEQASLENVLPPVENCPRDENCECSFLTECRRVGEIEVKINRIRRKIQMVIDLLEEE